MFKLFPLICIVALSVAYTHEWTSDDQSKESTDTFMQNIFSVFSKRKITDKDVNRSIGFAEEIYERMSTRETLLGYADVSIAKGSPSNGQYIANFPEAETAEIMKDSLVAVSTSAQMVYEFCDTEKVDRNDCANMLKYFKLWKTPLSRACGKLNKKCSKEEIYSKYRSLDGSCNNVTNGEKGRSFTVYSRLLHPNYLGGIRQPRRSVTKSEMVSPRVISSDLHLNNSPDEKRSLAVLYWAQFIEHDMSHTAMSRMVHTGKPIECCSPEGRTNSPRYVHPFCFPISVEPEDEYYAPKDISCISYVRSVPAVGPDCSLGPMQQINQATHFLDASQIYGTSSGALKALRNFTNGQMLVSVENNLSFLPFSNQPENSCQSSNGIKSSCFESGDKRVNENPYITAMYTVWVREHNRIASKLAEINQDWDDETIFQEARRIVIAEIQHITYSEWIPIVLGSKINSHGILTHAEPEVSNAFATAAIRAFQSVGSEKLSLLQDEERFISKTSLPADNLLKEMTRENFRGRSLQYIGEINNLTYGYDILSIDIQRGRDHGLPTYNEYRKYCGLDKIKSFQDLKNYMLPKTVESLQKNYADVDDIDLIVGGLAEKPTKGMFGRTIACILRKQFERSRRADRYFFTNEQQPMPFSESQLDAIEEVSFARILCDNVDNINMIQPRVFEAVSDTNPQDTQCNSSAIPRMSLELWNNKRYAYA